MVNFLFGGIGCWVKGGWVVVLFLFVGMGGWVGVYVSSWGVSCWVVVSMSFSFSRSLSGWLGGGLCLCFGWWSPSVYKGDRQTEKERAQQHKSTQYGRVHYRKVLYNTMHYTTPHYSTN